MDDLPALILPMLLTLTKTPPAGEDWIFEIKHDGYRMLARRDGDRVALFTRNGHNWTQKFPGVVESIRQLPGDRFWLDGELVVMTEEGRSCFGSLQEAVARRDQDCLAYYTFDMLYRDGIDLTKMPVEIRKALLNDLVGEGEWNLRFVDHVWGQGTEFFHLVREQKLEGIVSKRAGSIYRPGQRSSDWLKIKWRGYGAVRSGKWEWWKENKKSPPGGTRSISQRGFL